jgi:hypothetical protein
MLALAEAGAQPTEIEGVGQGGADEDRWRWSQQDRTWDYGPFKDGQSALVVGTLDYSESDFDGGEIHSSHKFRAPIDLRIWSPPPPAMMMPWSESYTAWILKRSGVNYTVEVPISHSLIPREADRLLIELPAEAASTHELNVTLLCSTGNVKCGTVRLEAFQPTNKS